MTLTIKGQKFDVEISGDSPYLVFRRIAGKIVPLATGETKGEALNNAIHYLNTITQTAKE